MSFLDFYTENFKNSPEFSSIQDAFEYTVNILETNKNNLFMQFNLDTATFGLEAWEKSLNIKTDLSKTYADRRNIIKSNLRSNSTSTKNMIVNIVKSYNDDYDIEVVENNSNYSFTIKFTNKIGIPENLYDINLAVEEIKPAHLAVLYSFIYITLAEVESMKLEEIELIQLEKFVI